MTSAEEEDERQNEQDLHGKPSTGGGKSGFAFGRPA
jgi:hypothetical protein